MTPQEKHSQSFRPGEHAPISGVYQVVHRQHREPHEVLILRGEELPSCRICRADVRFVAVNPVPHYGHDWDLTGPDLELVPRVVKIKTEIA